MKPQRIRLSRAKGFNLQDTSRALNGLAAMNVTRPSEWGNPFRVGQDGDRAFCVELFCHLLAGRIAINTKATIEAQSRYLDHAKQNMTLLRGRNLACWCPPHALCHADVLLDLANQTPVCEAL
jgi:hypothetical protein